MNMDLGDIRLGCSAAASADLLGGGQAGGRKPRRLRITIAGLKEELEDAEERLKEVEKSPER